MGNPVVHFEIAGKNTEELNDFYGSLFDWDIQKDNDGFYNIIPVPDLEQGICGHILPTTDEMSVSNFVSVYIQVDDLDASLEKVENHDGKTLVPPQPIPGSGSSFAMFLDPSGNCIGLYKA